jgi:sRNA-binding carbon storage regulator CsrA
MANEIGSNRGNLILRRNLDQSAVVVLPDGRRVIVTPILIDCDTEHPVVHLAINAPKDVKVNRSEIQARIDAEQNEEGSVV